MTIAWLRVVLKNITSPPNLILLLMSSGNLQPYTCKSMFHTLFHLLLKSQHNLHYDIACIMFHIIFSHPHSPLVILIDEYVISSNTLLYHNCIHHSVTLLPLLSLSIHSPPSVQSSQSPHTIPYVLKCKVAAIKGISKCYLSSPPFAYLIPITLPLLTFRMLIPLQRYRMGELWTVLGVLEELVKQKVFSSPVFPYFLLFAH